ncbi:MAG: pgl 1 [Verrucomicrobiales bacterium]|nr:pgl 1 [Verrucomicrobiales bacterium]
MNVPCFDPGMTSLARCYISSLIAAALSLCVPTNVRAQSHWMYVGTYTGPNSKGVYAFPFDTKTGKAGPGILAAETESPSFIAIHPSRPWLYAGNEINNFKGKKVGSVTSYSVDAATGKLSNLNVQDSAGAGPAYVGVDPSGKVVMVANYGSGSVASYKIEKDGSLSAPVTIDQHKGSGVNKQRQEGPHAHSIHADPKNNFIFAADLGEDRLYAYRLNKTSGELSPAPTPWTALEPGAGPRHFDFTPKSTFAFIINELNSTLNSYQYDSKGGVLTKIETVSTLPADFKGNSSTADIHVHPSGKFVYGSNRGHDSIAVFSLDQKSGRLSLLENVSTGGKTPRNFSIDPSGHFLVAANQESDNIVFFTIDQNSGKLTPTGDTLKVGKPVCIQFFKR